MECSLAVEAAMEVDKQSRLEELVLAQPRLCWLCLTLCAAVRDGSRQDHDVEPSFELGSLWDHWDACGISFP